MWSLLVNVLFFVAGSLTRAPEPAEKLQANVFVPDEIAPAPEPQALAHVGHGRRPDRDPLGGISARNGPTARSTVMRKSAAAFSIRMPPADASLLRFSEQLLASAIGAASSRLVLSLMLKRHDPSTKGAVKLLDDASARDPVQTATCCRRRSTRFVRASACFDRDLRLICWNRQFRDLLELPTEYGQVGTTLDAIIRYNAKRGEIGDGPVEAIVSERLEKLVVAQETHQERLASSGTVLEVRISPMPDGGIVTTYTDITERVLAEDALARANETLERRVRERTEELTHVNDRLREATHAAEEANIGKTRFLAAAGHDILQPLNAARLYSSVLVEKLKDGETGTLVRNVEGALESVEDIISAVLDISRLDTGALKPELTVFRLDVLFRALETEFEPVARERNLELTFVPTSVSVRSDRRLLRRLLQNLVSNALKYTTKGRVLVGCRRKNGKVVVEVHDTGMGVPGTKQKVIFQEFHRLDDGMRVAKGLGLGLSIVERIAHVLEHPVDLRSSVGKGSCFAVTLPTAAAVPVETPQQSAVPTKGQLDGLCVLAIDNEPDILSGMRHLLENWNCKVITARDDVEAIEKLLEAGETPDVIVIDYHLDDGNGIDAVVRLRWKFGAGIPALLVTADRSRAVRSAAASKNIEMFNKPIKPAALRAHLARCRAEHVAAE